MDDERKETRDEVVEEATEVVDVLPTNVVEIAEESVEELPIKVVEIPHDEFINLDNLNFGLDDIKVF